uniref:Uncharacterized protein n=1 Tax=Caenorhabditis japonica TaxID=281687 RepID=A0A8R1E298_CAEJA
MEHIFHAYSKPTPLFSHRKRAGSDEQVDALIDLLKTKNHWMGPLTDALIRNGKAPIAKVLLELQNGK